MRIYDDNITNETVVGRVFMSLHKAYNYVVTEVLESKDLYNIFYEFLNGS